MCFAIGVIVWTMQAVNYLDFVIQDGHGLKTYFAYFKETSAYITQTPRLMWGLHEV